MPDKRTQYKDIPLNGKWRTDEPAVIGTDFRTLKNLRYTDTHLRGVQGMTKINVTALGTYLKVRNAYHFNKEQPPESHVLAQAYNTALTASQVLENTAVIPATAAFSATELWTDAAAWTKGYFSDAPDGQMVYCNSYDNCIWGGNESKIGAFLTSDAAVTDTGNATNPRDYTEAVNNSKFDAANVAQITASARTWIIGTTRPAKGFKYYIVTANTSASTMTGKYHDGSAWQTMALTDNTDTGASLAVTGTVTFSTTVGLAKPKYLEGYYLYWYQFAIDAGTANIYHVTMDAPFQSLVDMWDGVFRSITRAYKYETSYIDQTIKLLKEDGVPASGDQPYYMILNDMAAFSEPNNCVEVGFEEKMTALKIVMTDKVNSTAGTTMAVDYWTGGAYVTVGTIADGTSEGGISLAKSGVVSWNNTTLTTETKKSVNNSPPLYYYRIRFDEAIDSECCVDYIGGIASQKSMGFFKFPIFAQGRVLLCCDTLGDKNKAIASAKYMPQVYNGEDSVDVYFGDDGELTCGTELFSQFGSSLYSLILMFKDNETWIMAGTDIDAWEDNTFLLSSTIGCPAPLTLKTINLSAELGAGTNRNLAIWQGATGVYMSDGRAPIPIHGDIKEYFDRTDSRCINASKVGDSVGFIDPVNQEYHLLIASGTAATTLNTELVYDIHRNKWFEVDRTADLQNGVTVYDTNGNAYTYGFLDTGYMERLENGTDFDGTDITHTLELGDFPLAGLSEETRVSSIKFFTVAKSTTSNNITMTHTTDCGTNSSAVAACGTITMSGVPTTAETFTIDTQTFSWVVTRATAGQVTIGANATACCANIVTAVSADLATVVAVATTATVAVSAATSGVLGNAIIFSESSTNFSMNGTGYLGGTTSGADATGTAFTMSPARLGYRVAIPGVTDKLNGDPFHSLKFEMTTDNETIGFEPMAISIAWHTEHQEV